MNVWGQAFQAVGIVCAKALRQEGAWRISRREKRSVWLHLSEQVGADRRGARSVQGVI